MEVKELSNDEEYLGFAKPMFQPHSILPPCLLPSWVTLPTGTPSSILEYPLIIFNSSLGISPLQQVRLGPG
jgi:hypothetical protein